MKKKITIIGAGITGIYAAILLSNKGHSVSVYESKKEAGGILRDLNNNENKFFKACQLINAKSIWFKYLKNISKVKFDTLSPSYGSYVENNNEITFSEKFSVPVFKKIDIKKKMSGKKSTSLKDRINLYDTKSKNFLESFLSQFNIDTSTINSNCAINLQVNRITSLSQLDKLKIIKDNDLTYDEIYAIDLEKLMNLSYTIALPQKGYDNFFDTLVQTQKDKINFYFNEKIKPIWTNGKLSIKTKNNDIESDYILWTGNPTPLLNSFSIKKMNSAIIKVRQISFNLSSSNKNFFYIQIFSLILPIYRIYIYQINNIKKISIEMIKCEMEVNTIIQKLKKILKVFNISIIIDLNSISESNYIRHDLITLNDQKLIDNLNNYKNEEKLIEMPWDIYGRDAKINHIVNNLKNINLL